MNPNQLTELLHDSSKPIGIYFGVLASQKSIKEIRQWCHHLGIDMKDSSSPYENRIHATIFCANEPKGKSHNDFQEHVDSKKIFIANPFAWTIIKSPNTKKSCLALKVICPDLEDYHKHLQNKTSLIHAFEKYEPHISIHYNYQGEIPNKLPNLNIELTEMYHKAYFNNVHLDKELTSHISDNNNHQTSKILKFN